MSKFSIRRIVWLLDQFSQKKRMRFEQIQSAWSRSRYFDGKELERHQFKDDTVRIGDMFDVNIECSQKCSHNAFYYVTNPEILYKSSQIRWLTQCLHMKFLLIDSASLSSRIILEDFPSENGNFETISDAMKLNRKIKFEYRPYGKEDFVPRTISPFFIKTYKYRFYVLGRFDSGFFCTFSFDRMRNVEVTDEEFFFDKSTDIDDLLKDYFGVYLCDKTPVQRIVVRAYKNQPMYLRDVPLHQSQREIFCCEEYTDFEYRIAPTNDFIGALLQQGDRFEVISPQSLRDDMQGRIESMLARYKKS